ncbi:MAG: GNAT family protein [Pseudomonadota bacterium]|nr:GNAT family protein [Pseudomonadota bacterium]
MSWPKPVTLHSKTVQLEPLSIDHVSDLINAVKDGNLYNHWYTSIPQPKNMKMEIERRLKLQDMGTMLPFAVISLKTEKAVGMTTYMNVEKENKRVEIGSTWYAKSVQRTSLNTECKLMLLEHAFENLACICVEFRTHFMNHQSRRGIERLGAKLDGILRSNAIQKNGTIRDTAVYTIISSEWSSVKANLEYQLVKNR